MSQMNGCRTLAAAPTGWLGNHPEELQIRNSAMTSITSLELPQIGRVRCRGAGSCLEVSVIPEKEIHFIAVAVLVFRNSAALN
jgi:hypothetical protein